MKHPFEQEWVPTVQPPEPDQVTVDQLVQRVIGVGFPTLNDSMLVTADGTSTPRPLFERAADDISVLDFGADPTGVADSSTAINAAITEAAGVKRVVLPQGTYRTAGLISLISGTVLEGRGATIVQDKTPDTYVMRGVGTAGTHLHNITVSGLHILGTNKPTYPADGTFPDGLTGGWGQIRFDYCDDVTVSNITWDNVHSCLVFQNCEGMAASNLVGHDLTDGVVTFFTGCKKGVFSNIQATNASECMDLFNAEDIVVTNVQGTGQVTPAHINEAFDISTVRRVSISNVVVSGFARGARIKAEGVGPGTGSAWSDIEISNMVCLDQTFDGINVQASATGYPDGTQRIKLSNIIIKSSVAGANGIAATPDATYGGDDCLIQGCSIDVPATGISAGTWTNLRIIGNKVKTAANVGIDVSATSTHGVRIEGNAVEALGGSASSSFGAINIARCDDVRVLDNVVTCTNSNGIRFSSGTAGGKRPFIARNTIKGAGYVGIHVIWANSAQIDLLRGGSIVDNDIRDWGTAAAGRQAILVAISNITGTMEGLIIEGNTMTLPSAASNTQSGITVQQVSGAQTYQRCRVVGNVVGISVPSTDYTFQGTWGLENDFRGNFPALASEDRVSADRGDASVSVAVRVDEPVQLFATTLTANRTVTLSSTGAVNGDRFRVVRTGLGAFTLAVGSAKTIPSATAAFVDVSFNGSAWVLTGYGLL